MRNQRNRTFYYSIQTITFEIIQIIVQISDGNLIDLGINLIYSLDSFYFKNKIYSFPFQIPYPLKSYVVISGTVDFDDTNSLAILGFTNMVLRMISELLEEHLVVTILVLEVFFGHRRK